MSPKCEEFPDQFRNKMHFNTSEPLLLCEEILHKFVVVAEML